MHYEKLYVELLAKKEDDRLTILHHLKYGGKDQLSIDFLPIYLNSLRWMNSQQAVLLLPWLNDNLQIMLMMYIPLCNDTDM